MNHTQNTYIASLLGYDGCDEDEETPELATLTPEQLLDLAAPLVAKINQRIPLKASEAEQHAAILAEAFRKLNALRQSELDERAARFEARIQQGAREAFFDAGWMPE